MARNTIIKLDALRAALADATQPGKRWSRRALSLAAGMGPDSVRDILSGKSKYPNAETVLALADILELPPSTFIEIPDEENSYSLSIPVIGTVEVGVWRERPFLDPSQAERVPTVVDKGIPMARFALKVGDLSMDKLFVPDDILYCEDVHENDLQVQIGHIIVVLRQKGELAEVSLREVTSGDDTGDVNFVTRSTQKQAQLTCSVHFEEAHVAVASDSNDRFDIRGIVKGIYRPLRGLDRVRDASRETT